MLPKLQVALDLLKIEDALKIAYEVVDYVDYIEAGTPLIKSCGVKAIEVLKREFSDKIIVADMKTADTGYLEAKIAFENGADYTTVLLYADVETISKALEAAREFNRGVMVDTIGYWKSDDIISKLRGLKPDYLIIHSGIDMQHRGIKPFKLTSEIVSRNIEIPIGVAGGLNSSNIRLLKGFKIDLIIVGGAIVKADKPSEAAKSIRKVLETTFT